MPPKATAMQRVPETSPLILVGPPTIFEQLNRTQEKIARRAYEIFESDGRQDGHDQEHWFMAESELLQPVQIDIDESEGSLKVSAGVPGFSANELEISLEPRRLTIFGEREYQQEKDNPTSKEHGCDRLLRTIELPVEIDADRALATLKDGVLRLEVPKAAPTRGSRIEVKAA